jgi:putatice virulence related protein PagC
MNNLLRLALFTCIFGTTAHALAEQQTISLGYAQAKVQDLGTIRGVNAQYRYEWNSPLSILTSVSYMQNNIDYSFYDYAGDYYERDAKLKDYSLLAGPAYRFNDMISVYGLIGLNHIKAKGDYLWVNNDHNKTETRGSISESSTDFAYGLGVIINATDNISINAGYEGTKVKLDGDKYSINGFNIGVGYRF